MMVMMMVFQGFCWVWQPSHTNNVFHSRWSWSYKELTSSNACWSTTAYMARLQLTLQRCVWNTVSILNITSCVLLFVANIMVPLAKKATLGRRSLKYTGPSLWNAHPHEILNSCFSFNQNRNESFLRINDEQLNMLRAHFDINNSPSEEQIRDMSEKTELLLKVIKHWFCNTLFKEWQRNRNGLKTLLYREAYHL